MTDHESRESLVSEAESFLGLDFGIDHAPRASKSFGNQ